MGKFSAGEMAILVSDRNGMHPETIGWDVEVKCEAPSYYDHDYIIVDETGKKWVAYESELRKKKPPEIDWVKMCNLKMPQKETV